MPANSISNWPIDDRPREKLLQKGEKALSNSELLSILLGIFLCQPFKINSTVVFFWCGGGFAPRKAHVTCLKFKIDNIS